MAATLYVHWEIDHFQWNFDKVFRQRLTAKLGMSHLGQALVSQVNASKTQPPLGLKLSQPARRGRDFAHNRILNKLHSFVLNRPRSTNLPPADISEWNLRLDSRSFARGGRDIETATDHLQSLPHAE